MYRATVVIIIIAWTIKLGSRANACSCPYASAPSQEEVYRTWLQYGYTMVTNNYKVQLHNLHSCMHSILGNVKV